MPTKHDEETRYVLVRRLGDKLTAHHVLPHDEARKRSLAGTSYAIWVEFPDQATAKRHCTDYNAGARQDLLREQPVLTEEGF